MAVRQDQVQIHIDFITDESRKLAQTLLTTKEYNKEIAASTARIAEYQKQLTKVGSDEAKRATLLAKIATEEKKVADNLGKVADEGKKVQALDLGKVAPAQLVERAKQLAQAMRLIPQSAPQFRELQGELAAVNAQLKSINATSKGIQSDGTAASPGVGGFFGSVVGKATVAIAAVQAVFASLQGLFNFARTAITEFNQGAQADAALASRIESTGGAAGRTLEQLKAQADELQKVTLFGDEETKKGQEILLTFTNIRDEIFDRTIPAAQDLSTVFGQDLQASSVQLGKALQDPVAGVTALRRVGISFSDAQRTLIKSLVDTNQLAEAQGVILTEVEKQVGGAARAAAEAGTGPYTILRNRFGEVQESIGGLLSQGLNKLRPAFEVVLTVLEKVTESLSTGEKATGEYAGAANFVSGALTALGKTLGFLYDAWQLQIKFVYEPLIGFYQAIFDGLVRIGEAIGNFIERAKSIPVIGTIFKAISAQIGFFKDLFDSLPATLAGFSAAASQAVDNVKGFFTGLVLSARILAKELELALTIDSDASDRLRQEITALKQQQADAAAAGKTIGQAYTEARNAALAQGNEAIAKSNAATAAQIEAKAKADAKAKALAAQLQAEEDAKAAVERRKKLLDADLKEVEVGILKREVVLENARLKDEIDEREYQNRLVDLKKQKLEEQLAVYRKFKQDQSVEALKAQNELLRIESETRRPSAGADFATLPGRGPGQVTSNTPGTSEAIAINQQGKDALLAALRNKFEAALITEQDYELQRLELKRLALAEEIAILQSATQPQVDEIKKREEEKKKVEEDIGKQRLENDRRLEELKQAALLEGTQALGDVFQIGADLLSKDEKSKQKHASVVKALEVANVQVNLAAEVSGIFANAQKSAIARLLGPVAGNVLAVIQAALAGVRAGIAISKINAQKFARGGYTGPGVGFRDETGFRPAGIVHEGEYVVPKRVVESAQAAPVLRWLESKRLRGYAEGGLVNVNTTPISVAATSPAAQVQPNMDAFIAAVLRFEKTVEQFPTEVKSRVVYTEIEEVGTELNSVRDDAAL